MYKLPTYHFHEIARVLSYPSRHYGGVQWVFSPPVHSLPLYSIDNEGLTMLEWIPSVYASQKDRNRQSP